MIDNIDKMAWIEREIEKRMESAYNIPIGWKFRDYHAARAEIAEEIVRLDGMLGRK